MGPFAVGRLLERTSFCWTENAVLNEGRSALPQPLKKTDELRTSTYYWVLWLDRTFPTEPLPFGDIRYPVAV
jgi:hypothetical protein